MKPLAEVFDPVRLLAGSAHSCLAELTLGVPEPVGQL